MLKPSQNTPMDRFVRLMSADIDGDKETADRLAWEMMELSELPPHFLDMRHRLRQCQSVEEMHQVSRSFS